jgi:hypothetical protein
MATPSHNVIDHEHAEVTVCTGWTRRKDSR